MMGTEVVPETLVSTYNQLTWLCAQEDFIEFSRHESFKLYVTKSYTHSLLWGVPFKTHPNNNHVLWYKNKIRSRSTSM
jgi:hypothetical protein